MPTTPLYLLPFFLLQGFFTTRAFPTVVTASLLSTFLLFVGFILFLPSRLSSIALPLLSASLSFLLDPRSFNNSLGALAVIGLAYYLAEARTTPYLATILYYLTL